ncbi:MAG: hypothetical protein JKX76_02210 [Colwellia sp.]|nr:hypothetical protein [Colwellia sp.]
MDLLKTYNGISVHFRKNFKILPSLCNNGSHVYLADKLRDSFDTSHLFLIMKSKNFCTNCKIGASEQGFGSALNPQFIIPHRIWLEGPAIICENGRYEYWFNGKLHRPSVEGPALINMNQLLALQTVAFTTRGRNGLQAVSGSAKIVGDRHYYFNGELHRHWSEGPAVIRGDTYRAYHFHNKLHRPIDDGPARINVGGYKEYWVDGKYLESHYDNQLIDFWSNVIFQKET